MWSHVTQSRRLSQLLLYIIKWYNMIRFRDEGILCLWSILWIGFGITIWNVFWRSESDPLVPTLGVLVVRSRGKLIALAPKKMSWYGLVLILYKWISTALKSQDSLPRKLNLQYMLRISYSLPFLNISVPGFWQTSQELFSQKFTTSTSLVLLLHLHPI